MRKRSQISIQFAWIFILIAGALILMFFIGVVYKQKAVSETKLSATIINQMETILTGAELSSSTVNVIDMPEVEVNFVCDADGFSEYSIKGTPLTKETPADIAFAPDSIKGKKLITWALEWSAPFKVMNFLYLTGPNIKYALMNPSTALGIEVSKDLPEELSIQEAASLSQIKAKGYHKVRMIFFENSNPLTALPDELLSEEIDVSAVKIDQGTVSFYKRSGSRLVFEGSIPYIDEPSLYGAIFSQDIISFECNMKKAFKRLNLIAGIYADRESRLKSYFTSNPNPQDCRLYYHERIADIIAHSEQCSQNIQDCTVNIKRDIVDVKEKQNILIRRSCPLVY